ncbi:MAG: hypothetical protein ACREL7_11505 [Longimicrobiales bacterium]
MSVYPGPEPRRSDSGGASTTESETTRPFHRTEEMRAAEQIEIERTNRVLRLAFAPLHKRAFGIAFGTACALFMFVFTAVHLVFDISGALRLELMRAWFYGYEVSWFGALVGTVWAFAIGFIGGWFIAFCRNLVIAINVFLTRTRAELRQTREFLDHI